MHVLNFFVAPDGRWRGGLGGGGAVSAWATRAVPVPAGGSVTPAPSVGTGDDNSGLYGWFKATWKRTRVASVAAVIVFLILIVSLGSLRSRGLPLGGWERIVTLLQQYSKDKPPVQCRPALQHFQ